MNDPSQILRRPYGMWNPPVGCQNCRSKNGRFNWKSKKAAGKRKKAKFAGAFAGAFAGVSGYMPRTTTNELRYQTRAKTNKRFYQKKRFNRFAPFAPRNTTSFIIRAKKSGGIASLISPCPITPVFLRTPTFSRSTEEELGVDGYGSMKGLIRLRWPDIDLGDSDDDEDVDDDDDDDDGSCESDVEQHPEMGRRLDCRLENRVDVQDAQITHLEEENVTLKERVYLIEREMGDLRLRMLLLETDFRTFNQMDRNVADDDDGGEVC